MEDMLEISARGLPFFNTQLDPAQDWTPHTSDLTHDGTPRIDWTPHDWTISNFFLGN